jgi:hypothetical protein
MPKEIVRYEYSEEKDSFIEKERIDKMIENNRYIIDISKETNFICFYCSGKELKVIKDKYIAPEEIFMIKLKMKAAVKINDLIIFKSNKIDSQGKDESFFYNFIKHQKINITFKEEYSFIYFRNGLTVIPSVKYSDYKYKVLLCACKKYLKKQKNGILLINMPINEKTRNELNNDTVTYFFHDTGNFEVYCFCSLLDILDLTQNNIINKRYDIKDTNYLLVGGFEKLKNKGMIKLYRVNYSDNYRDTNIEYIIDLKFDNKDFNGFKGPVSSITQSHKDSNILVTCWDGNVYRFEKPNVKKYDNKFKDDILFEEFFSKK